MAICLDKDTLSCVTYRRKIERALWVISIWIELGFSGEFCDVRLSCTIYTRKSGLPVRDRIFENFRKSKYRPKFLIWFSGIAHQRISLDKLWSIRKNWILLGESRWLQKVLGTMDRKGVSPPGVFCITYTERTARRKFRKSTKEHCRGVGSAFETSWNEHRWPRWTSSGEAPLGDMLKRPRPSMHLIHWKWLTILILIGACSELDRCLFWMWLLFHWVRTREHEGKLGENSRSWENSRFSRALPTSPSVHP